MRSSQSDDQAPIPTPHPYSLPTPEAILGEIRRQLESATGEGEAPTCVYIGLRQLAGLYHHLKALGQRDPAMPHALHGLQVVLLPEEEDCCAVGDLSPF